jgi:hypothetical protein
MKYYWIIQEQPQNTDWKFFKVCFSRREAIEEKKWFAKHRPDCAGGLLTVKYRIKQYAEVIRR